MAVHHIADIIQYVIAGGGIYPISGQQVSASPDNWGIEITYSDSSTATYHYDPTGRRGNAPGTFSHLFIPGSHFLMTYTENGRSIQFYVLGD